MTTYYTQVPTLSMRSRAAELVVLGRVGSVIATAQEYHDGSAYVRTTFAVEVDEVLKGELADQRLAVQVLGGRTDGAETPTELPVRDGEQMVLMLSDAGEDGVWVPYLGSAFVVEDSTVVLGDHRSEMLGVPDETAAPVAITMDELRRIVDDATRAQSEERSADRNEELPPVTERPDGPQAAGQPGAPEPAAADE